MTSWKKKVYEFAAKLEVADTVDGGENWSIADCGEGKEGDASKQGKGYSSRKGPMELTGVKGEKEGGKQEEGCDECGEMQGAAGGDETKAAERAESIGNGGTELEADDELLSDMEDIELDDQGNVIKKADSEPGCGGATEESKGERKAKGSPSSIFDLY